MDCRRQAELYASEIAFKDFCTKLKEICRWKQNQIGAKFSSTYLYENDKITVIIIADNQEKIISDTIRSILNQSFPRESLEIILWDNASTDGTSEILKEYEARYPENIILIRSDEELETTEALNAAMDYMSGDFVSFVEPKDKIEPDFLDALYCKIKLYNCEFAGCISHEDRNLTHETSLERDFIFHLETEAEKEEYISFCGTRDVLCNHMYSREFLERYKIRFTGNKYSFFACCISHGKRAYEMKDHLYYRLDNGENNI